MQYKNVLNCNQELKQGEHLKSKNGFFSAIMQDDGNFVLYKGNIKPENSLWSSKSNGKGNEPYIFTLTEKGNLHVIDGNKNKIYSNDNKSNCCSCYLAIKNDGDIMKT